MSPPRLYVAEKFSSDTERELSADRAHYICRVLRLRADDEVILFDGCGHEFLARIKFVSARRVKVGVLERIERDLESSLDIRLLQGISRGERMDFIIQKTTELGVKRISPLITERSVVRLDRNRAEKRLQHWRGIATNACEQCGRNVLPIIDPPLRLPDWFDEQQVEPGTRLILDPQAETSVNAVELSDETTTVLIGPEGGLSQVEHDVAASAGYQAVCIGPRILRTETAAIAVVSALQTLYGDF